MGKLLNRYIEQNNLFKTKIVGTTIEMFRIPYSSTAQADILSLQIFNRQEGEIA